MRSPLGATASRVTLESGNPLPSGSHAEPFHRAMRFIGVVPIAVKVPATTRSPPGIVTMAVTRPRNRRPNGDHVDPFHEYSWSSHEPAGGNTCTNSGQVATRPEPSATSTP